MGTATSAQFQLNSVLVLFDLRPLGKKGAAHHTCTSAFIPSPCMLYLPQSSVMFGDAAPLYRMFHPARPPPLCRMLFRGETSVGCTVGCEGLPSALSVTLALSSPKK